MAYTLTEEEQVTSQSRDQLALVATIPLTATLAAVDLVVTVARIARRAV